MTVMLRFQNFDIDDSGKPLQHFNLKCESCSGLGINVYCLILYSLMSAGLAAVLGVLWQLVHQVKADISTTETSHSLEAGAGSDNMDETRI